MLNPVLDKENFEKSKKEIKELCVRFEANKEIYLLNDYKEENVRVEFISPMFKALGWDMDNSQGLASPFIEVIHQELINVENKIKSPDYAFQIDGEKIFFVETKAPNKNLAQDKSFAYQVRRYGWAACLNLSILTNFKEFMIYETQTKPKLREPASIGMIRSYKYTDYVDKWEEIYSVLSKEAVVKGLFEEFVKKMC